MPIIVRIDVELAKRKMSVGEFSELVGLTPANVAVLKNGRAKAGASAPSKPCVACSSANPVTCSSGSTSTSRRTPMLTSRDDSHAAFVVADVWPMASRPLQPSSRCRHDVVDVIGHLPR